MNKPKSNSHRRYSLSDDKFIIESKLPKEKIASILNRSVHSIYQRQFMLKKVNSLPTTNKSVSIIKTVNNRPTTFSVNDIMFSVSNIKKVVINGSNVSVS